MEVSQKSGELKRLKNPSFSENILKFEKPRKTTRGIDVENMYAKFGGPAMIGS